MVFETSKVCPAYRHLGVADVLALGDELNRFGVLCMGLSAIPALGLIPDPPGRRVSLGLTGSRRRASAGCLVRCSTAVFVR